MSKFTLLFFATLGGYIYYWSYRNWKAEQERSGEVLFPVLRSIFFPFFFFSLVQRIARQEQRVNQSYAWNPTFLSALFLVVFLADLWLATYLTRHLSLAGIGLDFGLLLVEYYIFYKVQLVINRVSNDAFGKQNAVVTSVNSAWIILGFTWWFIHFHYIYNAVSGPNNTSGIPAKTNVNTSHN